MKFPDYAQLVRTAIERSKMTQKTFGEQFGKSEGAVNLWVRGKNRPSPEQLRKMAELVPSLKDEIERRLSDYEWHPKARELASEIPAGGAPLDPQLWKEMQRIGHAIGRNPRELLNEVVRFAVRKMAPQAEERLRAEEAKKKKKVS